ncbi:hypothetical protein IFM89_024342 [Coptis chinensis]|uniref:Uncharacterized protein n=1 Tax=Coptis chinensis TaxID=261450 RepID=A0A835MFU8_9MAGN|nr:hypothetical protein IFM89_024342 [Coptis chinensis]
MKSYLVIDRQRLQWAVVFGSLLSNGINYAFQQCHWHSPSEHTINGKRERQLRRKTDNGFTFESVLFESLLDDRQERQRKEALQEDENNWLNVILYNEMEQPEADDEVYENEERNLGVRKGPMDMLTFEDVVEPLETHTASDDEDDLDFLDDLTD